MGKHLSEPALIKVREYLNLSDQISTLEGKKRNLADYCMHVLEQAGERMLQAAGYRIQKVARTSIKYDMGKLIPMLREKGLASKVLRLVVDDDAMAGVLRDGLLTLEELQGASTTTVRHQLRVDRIKEE